MNLTPILFLFLALLLSSAGAQAHKRWLLPTDFALSEEETVTVDFSASNNLFYVDMPMPLAGVVILSPGGQFVAPTNPAQGQRRSSFDIEIVEEGTYRVYDHGQPMYFSSYLLPGEKKPVRARGPLAKLKADVPPEATEVEFAQSTALIETYVTLGAVSQPAALERNQGLAMEPLDHPNALYRDESARFRFTLNSEPLAGLAVTVTPEGTRYRDNQAGQAYSTDTAGEVEVEWPVAGRYLIEALLEQPEQSGEIAMRYYNYFLTVEVMAP